MTDQRKTMLTIRGVIITGLLAVFCTAGLRISPERHAETIAAMDVTQVLSYALVVSVIGNVALVLLFARLIMGALSDNTRAFQSFSDAIRTGICPMGRQN